MLDLTKLVVEGEALHTTKGRCHGLSIPTGIANLSISATYDACDPIARVVGWKATNPEGNLMAVAIFQKQGVWAAKDMHPQHPEYCESSAAYCNLTYYVLICDPSEECLQLVEVVSNHSTNGYKPGVPLTLVQILGEATARTYNLEKVEKTFHQMDCSENHHDVVKCSFTVNTNVERANLNWNAFQGFQEAYSLMGLDPIRSEVCDTILHAEESNVTPCYGNSRTLLVGENGIYRQTSGCRFKKLIETEIQPGVSWVEKESCLLVRMGGQATTYHYTKEQLAVNRYETIAQAIRKCYILIGNSACAADDKISAVQRRRHINHRNGATIKTNTQLPLKLAASLADARNLGFCPSGSARWVLSQITVFKKMVALGFTKADFEDISDWALVPTKLLNTTLTFTLAEYRQMMKVETGYIHQLFNSKSINYAAIGRAIVKHAK